MMESLRIGTAATSLVQVVPAWAQLPHTQPDPPAPQGATVEIQDDPWVLPDLPSTTSAALFSHRAFGERLRRDLPRVEEELRHLRRDLQPLPSSQLSFPAALKPQVDALLEIIKDPQAKAMDDRLLDLWQRFQAMDRLVGMTNTVLSLKQWQELAAKGEPLLLEQLRKRNQDALRRREVAALSEASSAEDNHFDMIERDRAASLDASLSSGRARVNADRASPRTSGDGLNQIRQNQLEARAIAVLEGRRSTEGRESYLYDVLFVRNHQARTGSSDVRNQANGIEAARDALLVAEHFAPLLTAAWSPLVEHWQRRGKELADLQRDPGLKGDATGTQLLLRAQLALVTGFRFHLWLSGVIRARLAGAEGPGPLRPLESTGPASDPKEEVSEPQPTPLRGGVAPRSQALGGAP
jgi:hypothetical protein